MASVDGRAVVTSIGMQIAVAASIGSIKKADTVVVSAVTD